LVHFVPYKIWPLKYIALTITSTPQYQTRQGMFYTKLKVLCFHPVDMHTPSLKIREDIEFSKVITAKQVTGSLKTETTREIEIITTNPPGLKHRQVSLPSDPKTMHYNLSDMHNLTPKIRGDMAFQK
jgi:hypothetical protein